MKLRKAFVFLVASLVMSITNAKVNEEPIKSAEKAAPQVEPQIMLNFNHFNGGKDPIANMANGWIKAVTIDIIDRCWGGAHNYQIIRTYIQNNDRCRHASGDDYIAFLEIGGEHLVLLNVPGYIPRGAILWLKFTPKGDIEIMDAVRPEVESIDPKIKKKGVNP